MPQEEKRLPLLGSDRALLPGSRVSGKPKPTERITVTLILRPNPRAEGQVSAEDMNMRLPSERTYLSREKLEATRGAAKEDISLVEAFATRNSLDVVEVNPEKRRVILSGTIEQLDQAFGIELTHYKHPKGTYRGHVGPVRLTEEVAPIIIAVLGLDNRPQAVPHMRIATKASALAYTPPQVAQLYDFPSRFDGSGQCIALIELGGGFVSQDLETYFASLGLSVPTIVSVSVDGSGNSPTSDPNGPDGEVMLDIEVAGSVAPKAQVVVYFAPNTDQGFVDAVATAIHDKQHNPSVLSISWGLAEANWTQQGMRALNQAFQDAALLGVTVCVASGDSGSSDGVGDGLAHVDFPASSPYVLGCGGTKLESKGAVRTTEVVWNEQPKDGASGGGISDVFPLPSWQSKANVPPSANQGRHVGRGIPDVCADADPVTGYSVQVDGSKFTIGGTSAVAPLWAGLIALINQKLGKPVGFLDPLLYSSQIISKSLHDITSGSNGAYKAGNGWDACTGLGSPDGAKLAASLSS